MRNCAAVAVPIWYSRFLRHLASASHDTGDHGLILVLLSNINPIMIFEVREVLRRT